MTVYTFDLLFMLIVVTCAVFAAQRSLVESAVVFLAALFSSLAAITFFEPVVGWYVSVGYSNADVHLTKYFWFIAVLLIWLVTFACLVVGFLRTLSISPDFNKATELIGRWGFGVFTGCLIAAFLLVVVQTYPASRDMWGLLAPDAEERSGPIMRLAPDYQLLSLVDYVCTPREAVTGFPWSLAGPVASTDMQDGRWSSFPGRFAAWREGIDQLSTGFDEDEDSYDEYTPNDDGAEPQEDGKLKSSDLLGKARLIRSISQQIASSVDLADLEGQWCYLATGIRRVSVAGGRY